jgi:hypothetical protein
MASKAIKVEISFKKLLGILEQLTPDEKILIKKKLESEKVKSWQEKFGRALSSLGKQNRKVPAREVEEDVMKAMAEVRHLAQN